MPIFLKQSTASQEIPLGYFVDSSDGDTAETGLTIANTDIKLWKAGATTLANKNSGGATHISGGIYYATLDATDTDTLGSLVIFVHASGALTVRVECVVLAANVYDSLIAASDYLQSDTVQVEGSDATDQITAAAPTAAAIRTEIDSNSTQLAAIVADTNELQTDDIPGTLSTMDGKLDTIDNFLDTEVAAILADTNELQTDWADGGRLDLILDTAAAATAGAGAITFTYTLTSSVDASPIADADVWVTSDQAGNNLLASGRTNSSGEVTFYLDAGTVYVWRQKDGWNFTNPDTETVA